MLYVVLGTAACLVIAGLLLYGIIHKPSVHLNLQLLRVKVPRETDSREDKKPDFKEEINRSEQLFSALLSIKQPFVFETAVHHIGEEIHFYISVPRENVDFAMRTVQGLFSRSQVEIAHEYNVFLPGGAASGAHLSLKEPTILPIRTYADSEIDTFATVISNLSKLAHTGEGAAVQILVRPAPETFAKRVLYGIEQLKKGTRLADVMKLGTFQIKDIQKAFETKKSDQDKQIVVDDEAVKILQAKIAKPVFSVNIRLIAAAPTRDRAEDVLLSLVNNYSQFSAPQRNSIVVVKPKNQKKLFYNYAFRIFEDNEAIVLNSAEIASLFHLPTSSTDVPHIVWQKTREAAPPETLPAEGVFVGESLFRGENKPIRLTDADRNRHLYIIGQTGTGKSAIMQNMITQDITRGAGVCLIDPHGELVDSVLASIPPHRIDDVIIFNPGDLARPLGLNMLEYDFSRPEQKTFIVNEMQAIFNRLFSEESMGPMFEQYMRNVLLLLMEDMPNEPATLVEVPRIMTDTAFRERKLARIKNPTVLDFWQKEASKVSGEASLANMAPYITSKFGNFISNDYMRPIIGQPKSAFDFRKVMDEGKILLVNLSKGRIGDINANLLGMVITGRILMAALARADMDADKRKDFYFYIDEFQNFTTDSIGVILSEARKYRLNLTLAHQFIEQLEDEIREAVFGNVGSLLSFRVGTTDTETLVKQFGPVFDERDLINLENRNAVVRFLFNGEPARPFNIKTAFYLPGNNEVRDKLKELSRLVYGRDNAEIEAEIYDRLRN